MACRIQQDELLKRMYWKLIIQSRNKQVLIKNKSGIFCFCKSEESEQNNSNKKTTELKHWQVYSLIFLLKKQTSPCHPVARVTKQAEVKILCNL